MVLSVVRLLSNRQGECTSPLDVNNDIRLRRCNMKRNQLDWWLMNASEAPFKIEWTPSMIMIADEPAIGAVRAKTDSCDWAYRPCERASYAMPIGLAMIEEMI